MIKNTILFLTMMGCFASINAQESMHLETLGEELVELEVLGGSDDHYFEGCSKKGFHFAVEETAKDIYTFRLFCGPKAKGESKILIIRETGI